MSPLELVPDNDWLTEALHHYNLIPGAIANHDRERAEAHEYDLLQVLVRATLAGAHDGELREIAKACAAVVFMPDPT